MALLSTAYGNEMSIAPAYRWQVRVAGDWTPAGVALYAEWLKNGRNAAALLQYSCPGVKPQENRSYPALLQAQCSRVVPEQLEREANNFVIAGRFVDVFVSLPFCAPIPDVSLPALVYS